MGVQQVIAHERAFALALAGAVLVLAGGALQPPAALAQTAFDCLMEPRLRIKLATPAAGVLREVTVDRGDAIRKGQVLARLESGVEQAQLDLAQARAENDSVVKSRAARLAFLSKKRERVSELKEKGSATVASLDEVESDFGVAREELREAESNVRIARLEVARAAEVLKLRAIVSPIDGIVAERSLVGGEYAYEQAPIMTIVQADPLNVEVFIPATHYGAIEHGSKAAVTAVRPAGGTHTATVEVIDPVIDSRSGTFGVRLTLPNPGHKIPAGSTCKVQFPALAATKSR